MSEALPHIRKTKQRTSVLESLGKISTFQSAQELYAVLKQDNQSIGLATVYRTLASLAEQGEIDTLRRADGEMVYRHCSHDSHHHHLVCRACGHTVEVEGPDVERWAHDVASTNGFTDVSHVVEIFGVCAQCQKSN